MHIENLKICIKNPDMRLKKNRDVYPLNNPYKQGIQNQSKDKNKKPKIILITKDHFKEPELGLFIRESEI